MWSEHDLFEINEKIHDTEKALSYLLDERKEIEEFLRKQKQEKYEQIRVFQKEKNIEKLAQHLHDIISPMENLTLLDKTWKDDILYITERFVFCPDYLTFCVRKDGTVLDKNLNILTDFPENWQKKWLEKHVARGNC
jgi:hypothetical protein